MQKMISLLPPQEGKLITRKYQALPFLKMNESELINAANLALIKIHVITGWNFPQEKEYQNILKEQFRKKIMESYPLVNVVEIEFAFRNNTTVKDWGKNMNICLIDEVMQPYLSERAEASKLELHAHFRSLPAPVPEKISDHEIIQISKGIYARTKNWQYISTKAYFILNIKLTEEEKLAIKTEVNKTINEMFFQDKNLFLALNRNNLHNRLCRKLAVAKYFEQQFVQHKN